jgi:hypothetical protein
MTQTRVNDPRAADTTWALGYGRRFHWRTLRNELVSVPIPHPFAAGSADGGLVSNVVDLAAWDIALSAGRVLSPASLRRMGTPPRLTGGGAGDLGLGWCLDRDHGRPVVFHSGGDPGFATCFCRLVDDGVTAVVLANRGGHYQGFPLLEQTLVDFIDDVFGDRRRVFRGMHGGIHDAVYSLARRIAAPHSLRLLDRSPCRS